MLEMRTSCERCSTVLANDGDAWICSFECTFCVPCADEMDATCPNCGGELVALAASHGLTQRRSAHIGLTSSARTLVGCGCWSSRTRPGWPSSSSAACEKRATRSTSRSTGPTGSGSATENDYDAIVLDGMLPGIDGFEVCRRAREAGRWAPVMLLTAREAIDDRVRGLDAGADDYLTKPFSFAELAARLRALVRRGAGSARRRSRSVTSGSIPPCTS